MRELRPRTLRPVPRRRAVPMRLRGRTPPARMRLPHRRPRSLAALMGLRKLAELTRRLGNPACVPDGPAPRSMLLVRLAFLRLRLRLQPVSRRVRALLACRLLRALPVRRAVRERSAARLPRVPPLPREPRTLRAPIPLTHTLPRPFRQLHRILRARVFPARKLQATVSAMGTAPARARRRPAGLGASCSS